jgi:hypothetical protein
MKSPNDFSALWKLGVGGIHPSVFIDFPEGTYEIGFLGLLGMAALANTPQIFLAILYFIFDSLMTSMVLASEWNDYAVERKGLRVSSHKKGSLRSTYFLSLPFKYSIPMILTSTLLHWLISQSLLLVSIQFGAFYSSNDQGLINGDTVSDYFTCGFSPLAIILVLILTGILGIVAAAFAFRKFRSAMPIAGSCSFCISAACHGFEGSTGEESENPEEPLMWGVTGVNSNRIGHCGFSSRDVQEPVDGRLYA